MCKMDNKTEVVIFHDMAEVIVEGNKVLVWVGTQTYTIRHLDEAEANEYNLNNSTEISEHEEIQPTQVEEQPEIASVAEDSQINTVNSEPRDQVVLVIHDDSDQTSPSRMNSVSNSITQSVDRREVNSISAAKVNNHNIEKVNLVDEDDEEISVSDIVQSLSSSSSNDGTEASSVSGSGQNSISIFNPMKLVNSMSSTLELEQSNTMCSVCFKSFSTEYSKKRHQLSHFGIKPYRCDFCMKYFAQSSSYYSHKCSANIGGFELPPPVSQISTTRKSSTPASSNSRRMLLCNACGKSFPGIYKLKRHEISHTGEKPYRCAICLRAFTQWTGMSRHNCPGKAIDLDKIPPACEECGKIFKNNKYLQIHRQIHKFDGRSDVDDKDIDQAFHTTDLELDASMDILREMFC